MTGKYCSRCGEFKDIENFRLTGVKYKKRAYRKCVCADCERQAKQERQPGAPEGSFEWRPTPRDEVEQELLAELIDTDRKPSDSEWEMLCRERLAQRGVRNLA